MKLRVAAIGLAAVLAISVSAVAQGQRGTQPGQRTDRESGPAVERPARQGQGTQPGQSLRGLGLTPEQNQKIREIMTNYQKQARTIAQSSETPEQKAAKMADLRKQTVEAVKGVLTPEQIESAEKSGVFARIFGQGRTIPGAGTPNVFAQLNLSEEQRTALQPVLQAHSKAVSELRQQQDLSPEERRAKMQKLNEEFVAKIKGILTEEQFKKFQELQSRLRTRGPATQRPEAGRSQTN